MPKVTEAQIAAAEAAAASARAERERVTKELAAARAMVEAARKAANDAEVNAKRIAAEVKQQGLRSHNKLASSSSTSSPSTSSSSSTTIPLSSPTNTLKESEFTSQVLDNNTNLGFEHNPFEIRPPAILHYTVELSLSESSSVSSSIFSPSTTIAVHVRITNQLSTATKVSPNTLSLYLPGDNDYIGIYTPSNDYSFTNVQCNHKNIEYIDKILVPYTTKYQWDNKEDIVEDLCIEGTVSIKLPSIPGTYELWYINENGIYVNKLTKSIRIEKLATGSTDNYSNNDTNNTYKAPNVSPATITSSTSNAASRSGNSSSSSSSSSLSSSSAVPILTSLPSVSPSVQQRTYRPPYILEKQVRISTYQLYIPLPNGIRTSTNETRVGGTSTMIAKNDPSSSSSSSSSAYLYLPTDWNPGVAIDGDNALNAKHQPSIEVQFELPQIPLDTPHRTNPDDDDDDPTPYSAYDASVSMVQKLVSASTILATLPRDRYRIKIFLSQRIDRSKCTVRLGGDHILIRLPMYYTGAAVTDRPQSLISIEETLSLRRQGRQLACRECGNVLVRPSSSSSSSTASNDTTMKAYVLPSEYWLEWVDFWMCHETSSNIFIPEMDFGAIRSTILMGETHLQIHPGDVRPQAIIIRPDSHDFLHQRKLVAESLKHEYQLPGDMVVVGFEHAVQCTLECARCMNTLGTSRFILPSLTKNLSTPLTIDSPQVHASYTLLPLRDQSHKEEEENDDDNHEGSDVTYVFSHDNWSDKLSPDNHPVLRLNKDRLSVPLDTDKEPIRLSASDRTNRYLQSTSARERNALYHYGTGSRIASDLLAIMYARSQYKYIIVNKDSLSNDDNNEGSEGEDEEDADHDQLRIFRHAKILLTIMNWNGSVKGNGNYRSWLSTDNLDIMSNEYKDTALPKARLGKWEDNRGLFYSDGIPVLQVRYRILDDTMLMNPEDFMDIVGWDQGTLPKEEEHHSHHHHHHEQHQQYPKNDHPNGIRSHLLFLTEEECETMVASLMASSILLPASVRSINTNTNGDNHHNGKEFVGYLPFWDV